MAESVYKVIELIGTSTASWEKAAAAAVKLASQSLRDLRIAEISQLDMQIADGKVLAYRAKVKLSFKYTPGGAEVSDSAPKASRPARAKAEPAAPGAAAPKKAAKKAKRRPSKA